MPGLKEKRISEGQRLQVGQLEFLVDRVLPGDQANRQIVHFHQKALTRPPGAPGLLQELEELKAGLA